MIKNTEEKRLTVTKKNVLEKIFDFFRSLFGKKESNNDFEKEDNNKTESNFAETNNENLESKAQSFSNSIKFDTSESDELAALQYKLENGKMKIEDLTDEQEDKLIKLYTEQIEDLEKRIAEKKKLIV